MTHFIAILLHNDNKYRMDPSDVSHSESIYYLYTDTTATDTDEKPWLQASSWCKIVHIGG